MLKRLTPLAAVAALLALAAIVPIQRVSADRLYSYCDVEKSNLCAGLVALYEFEEAMDYARTSETGSARLLEPQGSSIANTGTRKTGTYAWWHTDTSNNYLLIPHTVGMTGTFTGGLWIYIDTPPPSHATNNTVSFILSMKDGNGIPQYPTLSLERNAGTANVYPRFCIQQAMTGTVTCAKGTTALSNSTWYYISFGEYASPTTSEPYQQTIWVGTNTNARVTATATWPPDAWAGELVVGGWYYVANLYSYGAYKLDQFAVWGRLLSTGDVSRMYNSGSGKAYPFTS